MAVLDAWGIGFLVVLEVTTKNRFALVTGANKGIGFEIARQLAGAGLAVLLGSRDRARGEEAAAQLKNEGLDVIHIPLDVTDLSTITAAAEVIAAKFGVLDVLVNNAGINVPGDDLPSSASLEALDATWRTNFLGAVAVTQAVLPLLRKSESGRIVNVSSGLGSLTRTSDPASSSTYKLLGYAASKAALNMFTAQLASELRGTGIKVNSAAPGFTATDMNQHRGTQTVPEGAAEAVRLALLPDDGPTGSFSGTSGPVPW